MATKAVSALVFPLLSRLRSGRTASQDPQVPATKLTVVMAAAVLLAGQTLARYAGVFEDESWYGVHLAIGWLALAALLRTAHPRILYGLSPQSLGVLAGTAVAICGFWYLGRLDRWEQWYQPHLPTTGWARPVWGFAYFSLMALVFRVGIPALWARKLGMNSHDLGWKREGQGLRVWPIYVALYLVVLPFVVAASATEAFQAKYPLARALLDAQNTIDAWQFLVYQALYVLVFVSGECFWRGWIVFGLERQFGNYAILWMLVPYVFAHFGKPLAESLGAIVAGTVLGWLALQHRSVWLGVVLHYAVAATMDGLAMAQAHVALRW